MSKADIIVTILSGRAGSGAGLRQISNTYTEPRNFDVSKADIVTILSVAFSSLLHFSSAGPAYAITAILGPKFVK